MYEGEQQQICTLTVLGEKRRYRRLHVLEFDSSRKRMSVIVEFPDQSIWLICKGAETNILDRSFGPYVGETRDHITDFALVSLFVSFIA